MTQPEAPGRNADRHADRYADRYGRREPGAGRRAGIAAAAVLVLLGVVWAGWIGVRQARTPVRWVESTVTTVDDGTAQLAFSVTTDPGNAVVCTVRMFNQGLTEVGRIDVTVGPSSGRTFRAVATVPTFERATSARIRACAVR